MVSKLKLKLFKSIKSKKLNVFGFFLLLSFLFFVITKLSKTYIETIPFYVSYKNVPDQHSIVSARDSVVQVRVKAFGFKLVSHNFFKHKLVVDFDTDKSITKFGKNYYWSTKKGWNMVNSQLGSTIEILSIQPDSLIFPYEIMTVKTVPVKLDSEISFASGYDIRDSLKLEPDSVKVIGPKNVIEKITSVKTEEIKLKEVNNSINQILGLTVDKSLKNVKLNRNSTTVTAIVEKFTEGTFEVPVSIINLPANLKINYFPKTIPVSYYVSLENFKKVKALDFRVICDYDEVKNIDKYFFSPQLVEIPKAVKSAKLKQSKVEFIIIK